MFYALLCTHSLDPNKFGFVRVKFHYLLTQSAPTERYYFRFRVCLLFAFVHFPCKTAYSRYSFGVSSVFSIAERMRSHIPSSKLSFCCVCLLSAFSYSASTTFLTLSAKKNVVFSKCVSIVGLNVNNFFKRMSDALPAYKNLISKTKYNFIFINCQ